MVEIINNITPRTSNDDNHDRREREPERRYEPDDRCCEGERERFDEDDCRKKIKAPVVLAPVVAVTGGTTAVGAFADRVAIQILNNPAVIAAYTIVLQTLPKCEEGYVVIETAGGVTALTVIGANNVSPSALSTEGSYITLKWIGETWTQV